MTEMDFKVVEIKGIGDTVKFDTNALYCRTDKTDNLIAIYRENHKWKFGVFDKDYAPISQQHESSAPFYKSNSRRDNVLKKDLIDFGFCDKSETNVIIAQIGITVYENIKKLSEVKNMISIQQSNNKGDVDGENAKIPKLNTGYIIELIEQDILDNDMVDSLFYVNGIPFILDNAIIA